MLRLRIEAKWEGFASIAEAITSGYGTKRLVPNAKEKWSLLATSRFGLRARGEKGEVRGERIAKAA